MTIGIPFRDYHSNCNAVVAVLPRVCTNFVRCSVLGKEYENGNRTYVYIQKSDPFLSFSLPVLEYECLKWEQSTVLQRILKFSSSFYIAILCLYICAPLNFWTSSMRLTKLVINVMPGVTNHIWYLILGSLNDVWQSILEEFENFCWNNFIKCKTAWQPCIFYVLVLMAITKWILWI